jgi:hypothetical protein
VLSRESTSILFAVAARISNVAGPRHGQADDASRDELGNSVQERRDLVVDAVDSSAGQAAAANLAAVPCKRVCLVAACFYCR